MCATLLALKCDGMIKHLKLQLKSRGEEGIVLTCTYFMYLLSKMIVIRLHIIYSVMCTQRLESKYFEVLLVFCNSYTVYCI